MKLGRKLKIFAVITFIGVVLMTVSFVSPGWANVSVRETQQDYSPFFDWNPENGEKVHLSVGLWYFTICFHRSKNVYPHYMPDASFEDDSWMMQRREDSGKEKRCHVSTYHSHRESPFMYSFPSSVYKEMKGLGQKGLLEFQIISSIGIFFGVLGFIGTIAYTRSLARSRCAGLLACISLIVSGGTYIAAAAKTATVAHGYKALFSYMYKSTILHFHCPWALILGGVGGIFVLISAVAHLCILSRNKTNDDIQVYHIHKGTNQGIFSQHTYTTIAPPGYTATVGLKVPLITAIEKNEEAGPLPDKK
ncbi:uncharacterized protein LOC133204596 [Saccostrea echinata]|uniref:uncharacterized protein LOC133204596 n=1 Tax=Saccostrea echinata TaxID=191078 RepID=UPI002A80EDF2|nr:uncharacterized protein LOC133204596 [Saccostrea echinata]